MEKVTLQAKFPRNPQKAKEQKGTQGLENPSGQVINPWSDRGNPDFWEGWGFFESEVYVRMRNRKYGWSKAIVCFLKI